MSTGKLLWRLGLALTVSFVASSAPGSQGAMLAIVGCTVIDGNGGPPVHSKKSILRMKTAFIDCAEANFLFVVAICIVLS
jgi:hypothetical protein